MASSLAKRINRIQALISKLQSKTKKQEEVLGFIVYGSFSKASDHEPNEFSDVDLEIVVKDDAYAKYLENFRSWFEENFEPVLIETSVSHLNKILVTKDFVDLQLKITPFSDFDRIDKRELNYFPNGYDLAFDKTGILESKIKSSLEPTEEIPTEERISKFNTKFWYFVAGIPPYFEREEWWFAAAGYWAWLYVALCKLLRMCYGKNVEYNPMKHIEQVLPKAVLDQIQPLRNLETPKELKSKMKRLIEIYSKHIRMLYKKNSLAYDPSVENAVLARVAGFLEL